MRRHLFSYNAFLLSSLIKCGPAGLPQPPVQKKYMQLFLCATFGRSALQQGHYMGRKRQSKYVLPIFMALNKTFRPFLCTIFMQLSPAFSVFFQQNIQTEKCPAPLVANSQQRGRARSPCFPVIFRIFLSSPKKVWIVAILHLDSFLQHD